MAEVAASGATPFGASGGEPAISVTGLRMAGTLFALRRFSWSPSRA